MKISPGALGAALLTTHLAMPAHAAAQPWNWRFSPAAKSHWKLTIFERTHSLSAQDMIYVSSGAKGTKQHKRERQETIDQASNRTVFDVDVIASDAGGCQLLWTFRQMEATREINGWAESTRGDEKLPAAMRQQVQAQRRLNAQKSRNADARDAARFSQSLAGASFSCAISPAGRIIRFGSWEAWKKRVLTATTQAADGSFLEMAFRPLLLPDDMKIWVSGWTGGLPTAPIQENQSWQFTAKVANLDYLTPLSPITRRLLTRDEKRAVVEETSAFTIAPPTPKLPPNSVAYTFSCQGTRQAKLQVDLRSGVPLRTSRRMEIKGNRGVVNNRGGVLQDEAFALRTTSEIVAQPR